MFVNPCKRIEILVLLIPFTVFFLVLQPLMADSWDEDQLRRGDILFVFENTSASEIPEGHAAAVIDCPPEKVWMVINDYNNLKNIMPGVVESRIERVEGDTIYYFEKTHVPVLKDLWYRLRCVQDDRRLEKTMTLIEGSVRHLESRWSVKPFDDGKTLAEYSVRSDPGFYLPRWTQKLILHRTAKGFFEGLRKASCNGLDP
jgi:ribosome-associated toxin RatA of RatAB toxin-antitoxin module